MTRILEAIDACDPRASSELLPLVHAELRKLSESRLRHEKPAQTAREKATIKRGGGLNRANLDLRSIPLDAIPEELLDLDEALTRLAKEDPQKSELVKLKFFAGMSRSQAVSAMGISPRNSGSPLGVCAGVAV